MFKIVKSLLITRTGINGFPYFSVTHSASLQVTHVGRAFYALKQETLNTRTPPLKQREPVSAIALAEMKPLVLLPRRKLE